MELFTVRWLYEDEQGILACHLLELTSNWSCNLFSHPRLTLNHLSLSLSLSWWCNPIIYTQTTVLCLWGVMSVLMAERWAACLRGSEGEGGRVGEGQGGCGWRGWKSIMYTDCLPGWLAGYPSGTASHFLSTSPNFLLYFSALYLFYQQTVKWLQCTPTKKKRCQLTTGWNTRVEMTKHVQTEIILNSNPPPHSLFFTVSLTAQWNIHHSPPTTCPHEKKKDPQWCEKTKKGGGVENPYT